MRTTCASAVIWSKAKFNHLAILTMLMRGRARYGEGRTSSRPSGCVLRMSSRPVLCHERATIKGVHLQQIETLQGVNAFSFLREKERHISKESP